MKELVCVAPNGNLEVWEGPYQTFPTWSIQAGEQRIPNESYLDYIDIEDNFYQRKPEFWGREILSEL